MSPDKCYVISGKCCIGVSPKVSESLPLNPLRGSFPLFSQTLSNIVSCYVFRQVLLSGLLVSDCHLPLFPQLLPSSVYW